jgi:hypothetical protein
MLRIGFVFICLALFACHDKKKGAKEEDGFSYGEFSKLFHEGTFPYQLTDTGFLRNRDTTAIRSAEFASFIPDSLKNVWFGKGTHVRYVAMVQLPSIQDKKFFVVKASGNGKKMALLVAFKKDQFGGVLSFLSPDEDPTTMQTSTIDKAESITKTVTQKRGGVLAEGRDAYEYDADTRKFLLILTDPLNGGAADVINPIDTFSRKHKFAGDYVKDKKNFVSIRDGRFPNQLQVFVHLDRNEGACTGEIKGDLLMTSASTAVYRQGGDPCILSFRFTPSAVVVKEDEGCGSRRGLDCSFDGTFTRKKEIKPKSSARKK